MVNGMATGLLLGNGSLVVSSCEKGSSTIVRVCIKENNVATAMYLYREDVESLIKCLQELLGKQKEDL